jgi:hypothetical protein
MAMQGLDGHRFAEFGKVTAKTGNGKQSTAAAMGSQALPRRGRELIGIVLPGHWIAERSTAKAVEGYE